MPKVTKKNAVRRETPAGRAAARRATRQAVAAAAHAHAVTPAEAQVQTVDAPVVDAPAAPAAPVVNEPATAIPGVREALHANWDKFKVGAATQFENFKVQAQDPRNYGSAAFAATTTAVGAASGSASAAIVPAALMATAAFGVARSAVLLGETGVNAAKARYEQRQQGAQTQADDKRTAPAPRKG